MFSFFRQNQNQNQQNQQMRQQEANLQNQLNEKNAELSDEQSRFSQMNGQFESERHNNFELEQNLTNKSIENRQLAQNIQKNAEDYKKYKKDTDNAIEDILAMEISHINYTYIGNQNKLLNDKIHEQKNSHITDNQRTMYSQTDLANAKKTYDILFYIYFGIFITLVGWSIFYANKTFFLLRLCVLLLFLLFPFFMSVGVFQSWYKYIRAIFLQIPFSN